MGLFHSVRPNAASLPLLTCSVDVCSNLATMESSISACEAQITYSYEGEGHELRNDQAALDYCFMLPHSDDSRLFHVDALASMTSSSEVSFLLNYIK